MRVSELNVYPIKSLKGIGLVEAHVEKRGFRHDRRRMITDDAGVFLTQREVPKMAAVTIKLTDEGLEASAEGFGTLRIADIPNTDRRRNVTIWKSVCDADVYDDHVNEWFSGVLGRDCRLVYMPDVTERQVNPAYNSGDDIVSFADGYPFMLLGEASLADLNSRMEVPLPMDRFRPNFVVSGSEAFAEDTWKRIRIGETVFRVAKPSERCTITTVDQSSGKFAGKEPLLTLAKYRRARQLMPERIRDNGFNGNALLFGQNLIAENPGGLIRRGDRVEVLETAAVWSAK